MSENRITLEQCPIFILNEAIADADFGLNDAMAQVEVIMKTALNNKKQFEEHFPVQNLLDLTVSLWCAILESQTHLRTMQTDLNKCFPD